MTRRLLACATALAAALDAGGATVGGVSLRPVVRLDGQELALSNCGVRDTLWIEHYVAGLYVPRGVRAEPAVRDPQASKVLVVHVLDTGHFPEQLPEKWRKPLRSALTADKFSRVTVAYEQLRDGDAMLYSYSPRTGLTMTVNGRTVINAGHEVIDALLGAWQRDNGSQTLGQLLRGHDC